MASGKYTRKPEQLEKHRANSAGEKNPNWKGGIKALNRKEYSNKYSMARRARLRESKPPKVELSDDEKKENKKISKLLSNHRRRARIKSIGGSFTYGEWDILKKQYNHTCPACRRQEPEIKLSVDHIIPIKHGGSNNIENIQPLCRSCNCKKSAKLVPKYDLLV